MRRREVMLSMLAAAGGPLINCGAGVDSINRGKKPTAFVGSVDVKSIGTMLDLLKRQRHVAPVISNAIELFLKEARLIERFPIARRVYKYEDVGKHRTRLDGRTKYLEGETRQVFALAISDLVTSTVIANELPVLAAAVRLTGDEKCCKRLLAQLYEVTTWSPLQRPGWSCHVAGRKLPLGGDGNWLATGVGVRALADTLEILPANRIPNGLRGAIHKLLGREIVSIADDWTMRRPWFVKWNNPISNQWVLPTEGLVRACLLLGRKSNRRFYELGVSNLLMALNAHGSKGEFEEGLSYAYPTMTSLVSASRAMATAGDRRALDHPYFSRFPEWVVQHIQPAGMLINCFDSGSVRAIQLRPFLTYLAVFLGSDLARWAVEHFYDLPARGLAGLLYRALPEQKLSPPKRYAAYTRATRVNWRSSWDRDATGVWVRGGHRLDQHDHNDRGHVNFISGGKAILIEAGKPSYAHPNYYTYFSTGVGHNVLQVGLATPKNPSLRLPALPAVLKGWQLRHTVAPISVHRLDPLGGDVTVVCDKCYDRLKRWRRRVAWKIAELRVTDVVELASGECEVLLFRWHLGTKETATIRQTGGVHSVSWPNAKMTIRSSEPLTLIQELMPDATLDLKSYDSGANLHRCLIVRSRARLGAIEIATVVVPRES